MGLPFNVTQYATLLSMIAQVTNLNPGFVSYSINEPHIYVNHIDGIKEQLRRGKTYESFSRMTPTKLEQLKIELENKLLTIEDKESNEEIKEVLEEDKYVELYDKSEYFAHYPSIRETIYEHEVVIDAPPPSEKENKNPFIVQFGTTLVMLASSSVMAYNVIYGIISGRNIWSLIPQMVMCVAMLIGSLVIPKIASGIKRKNSVKNEEKRISRYKEYLLDKERELGNLIKNELQIMNDNYPSADSCVSIIENKNKNFWWCQYNDKEFLNIRVGTGRVKSNVLITAPEKHFTLQEDELLSEVYKVASRYEYIEGAPITLSLKDNAITSVSYTHLTLPTT